MGKCKVLIEIEITFNELQYTDGPLTEITVKDNFTKEFKSDTNHMIGWDFEYEIQNPIKIEISNFESELAKFE